MLTIDLNARLDTLFESFLGTADLVEKLVRNKSNPQEILILICARLDALSCSWAKEEESKQKAFVEFLNKFGGHPKFFDKVSTGDLYYELDYHLWVLPGMLEKAGRIHAFSRVNDPVIHLLVNSEIPLTLNDSSRLLQRIQHALRKEFRALPRQSHKLRVLASSDEVISAIEREFASSRHNELRAAFPKALAPLLAVTTLGSLLYQRFRCEVIHGGRVFIDEARFFDEAQPYWKPLRSKYYGPVMQVEFPASFLIALLYACIRNYKQSLLTTRKLPPDVHFGVFQNDCFDHLDLLDQNKLPEGRTAVPRLRY